MSLAAIAHVFVLKYLRKGYCRISETRRRAEIQFSEV